MGKASRSKSKHRIQRVLNQGVSALKSVSGTTGITVRSNLPQNEKISHALTTLLEAEVAEGSSLAEYRAALDFIATAWNISHLAPEKQTETIRQLGASSGAGPEIVRDACLNLERLIARKKEIFPNDNRILVTWNVEFQGPNLRVTAAALAK